MVAQRDALRRLQLAADLGDLRHHLVRPLRTHGGLPRQVEHAVAVAHDPSATVELHAERDEWFVGRAQRLEPVALRAHGERAQPPQDALLPEPREVPFAAGGLVEQREAHLAIHARGEKASVHDEALAGDEAGGIGREQHRRADDFAGVPKRRIGARISSSRPRSVSSSRPGSAVRNTPGAIALTLTLRSPIRRQGCGERHHAAFEAA